MSKEQFMDIIFAAAWISVFISGIISVALYAIFSHANILLLSIIIEAVVMYFTCRYLYSRRIDS